MLPHSELQYGPASREAQSPAGLAEWLDKRRWLCYSVLCLIPFLAALPLWIFHLSVNPIWYFSGAVESARPGSVPGGLPFADPNLGWISQALGHLAAWQWIQGEVPWWNSYSGIGLPLAGGMQPGAFFLPFILLLLLHNGFLWLRIAMQVVAGFSTFALLRELNLGRLAALMGGVLFELNGTFAFTPGPAAVFCSAAFLPLLLLGIEQIANFRRERTGIVCVALGLAFSLLAGFPEVAYIDGLLALVWSLCRFATLRRRWRFAVRVGWGGLLGLLLSAPLLIGFWSLFKQSSAFQDHLAGLASLPLTAIPSIFVPYIFGPFPGTLPGKLDVWGASGYAGILLFFFSILGLLAQRPAWLRFLLIAWAAICGAKDFGLQPLMAAMNHIPFVMQTSFSRYSPPSWTLSLIILVAFSVDEMRHRKLRFHAGGILALAALVISICIAWPRGAIWGSPPAQAATMSEYLVSAAGFALVCLVCAIFVLQFSRGAKARIAIAALLALNFYIFFSVPLLSACRPGRVDRAAVRFLQSHLGLSRFYSLSPIEPNYSAYFQAASINYVALPVPGRLSRYLTQRAFPALPNLAGTVFWSGGPWFIPGSGLSYLNEYLPEYENLGAKYVVADSRSMPTLSPQVKIQTAAQGNFPLALQPGQQVQLRVPVPALPAGANSSIRGVSVVVGTYGNTADGSLAIRFCAGETCVSGTRALSEAADNNSFYIPLAQSVPVQPGMPGMITMIHTGGSHPVALWVWPELPNQARNLLSADGKPLPGKALRVSFAYDSPTSALPRVYHDALLDIFELPNPAPYYSVASGGSCRLGSQERDSVEAACDSSAVLVRRELYMSGWRASLQGKRLDAQPYDEIFQSYNLPRGHSGVRFAYAPPHASLVACVSFFALAAVLTELLLAYRNRSQMRADAAA